MRSFPSSFSVRSFAWPSPHRLIIYLGTCLARRSHQRRRCSSCRPGQADSHVGHVGTLEKRSRRAGSAASCRPGGGHGRLPVPPGRSVTGPRYQSAAGWCLHRVGRCGQGGARWQACGHCGRPIRARSPVTWPESPAWLASGRARALASGAPARRADHRRDPGHGRFPAPQRRDHLPEDTHRHPRARTRHRHPPGRRHDIPPQTAAVAASRVLSTCGPCPPRCSPTAITTRWHRPGPDGIVKNAVQDMIDWLAGDQQVSVHGAAAVCLLGCYGIGTAAV